MTAYKYTQEYIDKKLKPFHSLRKWSRWLIPFECIVFLFAFIITGIQFFVKSLETASIQTLCLLFIFILGIATIGGIYTGSILTRKHNNWLDNIVNEYTSTEFILLENRLVYRQLSQPLLEISREQIEKVIETRLGLLVHTNSIFTSILISKGVERYEQIKFNINNWIPVKNGSRLDILKFYWYLPTIILIGLPLEALSFYFVFFFNSLGRILAGIILLLLLVTLLVWFRRKFNDNHLQRRYTERLLISLPVILILARLLIDIAGVSL